MKFSDIVYILCMCRCNAIGCIMHWLSDSFKDLKKRNPCPGDTLDLTHGCGATVYKKTENGVLYKTFTPKNEQRITEVTDEGGKIWKANESETCLHIRSYYRNHEELLTICTHSPEGLEFLRFEKRDNLWVSIGKLKFMTKLAQMKETHGSIHEKDSFYQELLKEEKKLGVKLDILNINPYKTNVFDSEFRGVRSISCSPKTGFFRKIMEGKDFIWKAQPREICTLAYVYCWSGSPRLVAISTRINDNVVYRHFERAYLGWYEITEDAFCMAFEMMEDSYRFIHS
ncbi:hypothetical protein BEWA_000400 [Theileria equi strain WA]|uniref:Signal peptide containing protein n=1 Tax=Theileria equi strain WA TaxID=1537102 RepID=L0AYJ2_THEEQ|nr:hypothetical protein BEWA_000400 [Theileria equi strain WA]AFZ80635.1 hypothetical protein BEWA_000400 [Theileria equi strain WA]|eukprot:XP_004830301.1 hypothetical protein BEWA_000400 [Theileria equi strain WA]